MITDIKLWPVNGNKVVKANGSFVYGNAFRINFTVMSGAKGLWVALPSDKYEKDGETKYSPRVSCIDESIRNDMTKKILDAFTGGKSDQGHSPEPSPQVRKNANIPF